MTTSAVHTASDHSASQRATLGRHALLILNSLNLPVFHEYQLSKLDRPSKSDSIKGNFFWLINILKILKDLKDLIVQNLNLHMYKEFELASCIKNQAKCLSLMTYHIALSLLTR